MKTSNPKEKQAMKHVRVFFIALCVLLAQALSAGASSRNTKSLHVLVSTYPIYQITRNVTKGVSGVSVKLMIPGNLGCPHDYGLTPQDMKKIAETDVFVVNGLGMEEFMGKAFHKTNPGIKIIDSSKGIKEIMAYSDDGEEDHGDHDKHHHDMHGDHHGHDHHGLNPHLFASPRMAALIAGNIANGLGKADPAHARQYVDNAKAYAGTLNGLARQFREAGKTLKKKRIVTQHGVFDYLARDMGLSVVAVISAHAGHEMSAHDILHVVSVVRKEKPGAIFTEPQYPDKEGKTISAETGIPVSLLDPVASGPDDAPLDYYEKVMKKNLETLVRVLGK
jgi:ABC-type Zn uptake system ZnuABC Zn-binding protein ZnuA